MRTDFDRVFSELPRNGSRLRNHKTRFRIRSYDPEKDYDLPMRDSMRRRLDPIRKGKKESQNSYAPIRRYLRSNLGRPWDSVYALIRRVFPYSSSFCVNFPSSHHIVSLVSLHCVERDGQLYESDASSGKYSLVSGFYVHPVTKLLGYIPPQKWRDPKQQFEGKGFPVLSNDRYSSVDPETDEGLRGRHVIKIDDTTRAERFDGIWYLLIYRRRNPEERISRYTTWGTVHERTLPPLQFLRRKQLSSRELRKYGLRNDNSR